MKGKKSDILGFIKIKTFLYDSLYKEDEKISHDQEENISKAQILQIPYMWKVQRILRNKTNNSETGKMYVETFHARESKGYKWSHIMFPTLPGTREIKIKSAKRYHYIWNE